MANVTRYDPFGDVFDDLLKGFFVRPMAYEGQPAAPGRIKIDVTERNGAYVVHAEIPGVKKEDIQVSIEGDQVSISAEARAEKEVKDDERVLHRERYYGKVARAFRLGTDIDQSTANAKYADGVLELTLPKKADAAGRQLTIQ
ncbi:MAG: Hsp20/alpha crystallin family protein [Burkholderiales bacterium]|nr:Hsp20/alpha crystallin family protein [Burkholderiales bacterium]